MLIKTSKNLSGYTYLLSIFLLSNNLYHILKIDMGGWAINVQLLAQLLIAIFFISSISNGRYHIFFELKKLHYYLSLYILYIFFSFLVFDFDFNIQYISIIVTLIFSYSVFSMFSNKNIARDDVMFLAKLIVVLAILQSILGVLQIITGKPLVIKDHSAEWSLITSHRASGTYRDPVNFAYFVAIGMLLVFFRVVHFTHRKLLLSLFLLAISLSQSFTVMLALLISFSIYYFSSWKRLLISLFSIIIIIVAIVYTGDILKQTTYGNLIVNKVTQYTNPDDESRLLHLQVGIDIFFDSKLMGVGYGMYDSISPSYVKGDNFMQQKYLAQFSLMEKPIMISHNIIATIIAELGILGLILFLLFYFQVLKVAIIRSKNSKTTRYFLISVIVLISCNFLLYGFRLSDAFLYFLLAFLITIKRMELYR